MKVILTKDVDTLGDNGEIIEVSDGYFRNYLGPKKMAILATAGSLADLERRIERIRAKAEKKHQEDLAKAKVVTDLGTVTIEANAGETGKLYGTVTTKELTRLLQEKTGMEYERRNIHVDRPVSRVGSYTVYVKFSAKVSAEFALEVTALKAEHEAFKLEDAFEDEQY